MAKVIFWEKPGCKGNGRQKDLLLNSGHELDVRNLLTEPWTNGKLELFFNDQPIADCFNQTNPQIKAGIISPGKLSREEALNMMVAEPLLILRPLMQVGEKRLAGFDVETVHRWVGLNQEMIGSGDPKNCPCVKNED